MGTRTRELLICAVVVLLLVACASGVKPCRITEVTQTFDYTTVYVEINPANASLPWTISSETVTSQTKDGKQVTLAGCAPARKIIFGIGFVIKKGEGREPLSFDVVSSGNSYAEMLTAIEREPKPGEIALAFKVSKDDLISLNIRPREGEDITLSVP